MNEIDLQPVLLGGAIKLRPLELIDFESLYRAASDPEIWELHPDSERYQRELFKKRFFEGALACGGALVIEDTHTSKIIGSSRYYEWDSGAREISIGYTFIERAYWGEGANKELKQLMLNHIFQWVDVVWFHVGKINMRSRSAVEKLGAVLSHEKERELDGRPFTQLYYKLDASTYNA